MKHKIQKQVKQVDDMIDKCYAEQLTKLNEHHQQLKKQLQDELSQKEIALTAQLEDIKSIQDQLVNMKKQRDGLERTPDRKVLSKKKEDIENSMQEVSDKYKTLNTLPVETDSIEFVSVNNRNLMLGHLFTSAHPHTSEVVNLPHNIGYNTKVDFTIQTRNCKGEKCTKGGHHISVELKSVTGNVTIGEVKDNSDGSYVASFVAGEVGDAKLRAFINGQQIRGSPYSIVVGRNYQGINMPDEIVNYYGGMSRPWGIAFGKDGMWVVTDYSYHCVYIFNGQNELVIKFGSNGSSSGQFSYPHGVAFDSDNHFYIADDNHRVQKFSINGNYLLQFGNDGGGKLRYPRGITTHNNKVYVADSSNHRIAVFQTNGQFCNSFSSEHLSGPFDVAVNTNNQLLVVDCKNDCVVTFSLDGHYVGIFGTQGCGRDKLKIPRGLAIDINGFVLVAVTDNHQVAIFDKFGNFIDCFGSKGSNAGQFSDPRGIALSPNGSIYISDSSNKRVQIFSNY